MTYSIELFLDLKMTGPAEEMPRLKEALVAAAVAPWSYSEERYQEQEHGHVLFMERAQDERMRGARLILWPLAAGTYAATNVVPAEGYALDHMEYNDLLEDFAELVAKPAVTQVGFNLELSDRYQTPGEWFSESTAKAFRTFSKLANKQIPHPLDQQRWRDFLIAAHTERYAVDSELIYRWLVEVEHWSEERARAMQLEYDFSQELLKRYDETR